VYFFREPGEFRSSESSMRIVRVGTHAISSQSNASLRSRIRAHRGTNNGGGNHRGSVFRKHVGFALLARDHRDHPTWGHRSSASASVRESEKPLEARVSAYLGAMAVSWIAIPDEIDGRRARTIIERNSIALLASQGAIDRPSSGWLGFRSPAEPIRRSGLWNVNHVDDVWDSEFLDVMESIVNR
jgi:hypothetical protein